MAKKASVENKSKRTGYSVVIVPQYEGRARQFRVSRLAIYTAITAFLLFVSGFVYVIGQNTHLRNTVAQYDGMGLDQVVRLQATQLEAANEAITTNNAELAALKKYVSYLGTLDAKVRKTLGVGANTVSLASVLKSTATPTLSVSRGLAAGATQLSTSAAVVQKDAEAREKNLIVLQDAASKYNSMLAQTPSLWPLYGLITSDYGWRSNPFGGSGGEYHDGVDIAAPYGTAVRATADGKVEQAGWNSSYGISVTLYHRDGIETLYGHMCRAAVSAGQTVKKGQVIGYEGSTGRATGAHVHYEVMVHGSSVNPMTYLD
ncbi:MAG TPA: M23 family metallopeptidase [Clostridia bacterium]|nr:M23 family metallopeptidase [Clostridia bacterium]